MLVKFRHAELVSASTYQQSPSVIVARWTLKQVQGDAVNGAELFKIFLIANGSEITRRIINTAKKMGIATGVNSIFTGDKPLTAPNPGDDSDAALFERLGSRALQDEEPMPAEKNSAKRQEALT